MNIGPFESGHVVLGDCADLIGCLPDGSVDIVVTSPPYWGQRLSNGVGVEEDPRAYVTALVGIFAALLPKLKPEGIAWLNVGDAYDTPVNWREDDRRFSTLGAAKAGLAPGNSAYTKPRARRRAFVDPGVPWLSYGNLLGLPYRLVLGLCDRGWLLRGEVVWRKLNALPEGRARRPHRQHEPVYLLARSESHRFRVKPPVPSVWEMPNDKVEGPRHYSRFPLGLAARCIEAYGKAGPDVVVLDPFCGSGTAGVAAVAAGCSFVGFEIDPEQADASDRRIAAAIARRPSL